MLVLRLSLCSGQFKNVENVALVVKSYRTSSPAFFCYVRSREKGSSPSFRLLALRTTTACLSL